MNSFVARSSGKESAQLARPRVLVAEDDQDLRQLLCLVLNSHYEVEAVADGKLAWAAVQRFAPALLLTDLQMPNLDGLELIRRLRAQPRFASLPIILLTACQEKERVLLCLVAGANDLLLKPFGRADLLTCVQVELGRVKNEPWSQGCSMKPSLSAAREDPVFWHRSPT